MSDMKKILTCLCAVLGLNSACGQGVFENTDVQGFAKLVTDNNVVVLDVRTASEFAEGHLERAINIDYHQNDFVEKAKATLSMDKKIAVYCRSGRRSEGAAKKLGEAGYKLVNLKGGIIAWKEANMPVKKELVKTQYLLPTGDSSMDEKERPLIEVYLPMPEQANGCAVVLCPGGAMRWLSWESDVVKMASFLNEHGIAAIGLRYHLNKGGGQMPQGMQMPPMVDVTHPEQFPQADANPMHFAYGDSIICLAAEDAKAAIRMVREHADEWHISKDKIGYLGFSAGGGVAIAATMSAKTIERPDFLCTNFGPSLMPVTVPADAPPLLIMTRVDHPNVAAGLVALFMEWKKAGANAELHMYGDGKGPYELMPERGETTTESWSRQLIQWLKAKRFYP